MDRSTDKSSTLNSDNVVTTDVTHTADHNNVLTIVIPDRNRWLGFNKKPAFVIGIIQIILAIPCIVINVTEFAVGHEAIGYIIFCGIWCSPMFIMSGAFAIASSKGKESQMRCRVITTLVTSILASVLGTGFTLAAIMTLFIMEATDTSPDGQPMIILLLVLAVIETSLSITVSVFSCCTSSCCSCCSDKEDGAETGQVLYIPA